MPTIDLVVALLGVVMAAAILSRNSAMRGMPARRILLMAVIWGAIIAGGALLVGIIHDRI